MVKNKVKKFLKNHPNPSWDEVKTFLLSLGSKQAWGIGKKLLLEQGINVDALQGQFHKALAQQRKARAKKQDYLIFYSHGCPLEQEFCIADHRGRGLWHREFFGIHIGQLHLGKFAEIEAAKKAIWLAGKAAESSGKRLTLFLFMGMGRLKLKDLRHLYGFGHKYNVDVIIKHIDVVKNPAEYKAKRFADKHYDIDNVVRLINKGKKPKLD